MIFDYPKAPVRCIDGVSAHKAGEWEGLKSSKFMPTRRNIQPKNHKMFFAGKY